MTGGKANQKAQREPGEPMGEGRGRGGKGSCCRRRWERQGGSGRAGAVGKREEGGAAAAWRVQINHFSTRAKSRSWALA